MKIGYIHIIMITAVQTHSQEYGQEDTQNGIYTNMPMLFLRYFVKIFEFVKTRN